MQIAHHYFENALAYFTRRINRSISLACANGEVAPFVGHNAYATPRLPFLLVPSNDAGSLRFLRWSAIQDSAFIDPNDRREKIWSEHNVSEDFDMAMRLQEKGYIIRWSTYSNGEFKEGVSLTVDDELNRWQKYSYGCSELLFNPFAKWLTKGPINVSIHRFVWCSAPLHYKLSIFAYMFSYCKFPLPHPTFLPFPDIPPVPQTVFPPRSQSGSSTTSFSDSSFLSRTSTCTVSRSGWLLPWSSLDRARWRSLFWNTGWDTRNCFGRSSRTSSGSRFSSSSSEASLFP